jgi:hypothetical protein
MSKPKTRRVILRAARFAIASGGICLLLSLPAKQAQAGTGGQPSLPSGLTGVIGSIVNSVTEPVTSTVPIVAQVPAPTNQATPTASASPASQSTTPPDGQASPNPTATSPVTSPTGAATPTVSVARTVSGASQSPTPVRSMPTSGAGAPVVATTSHAPTPATRRATPAASKTAKASAPVTTEPTPVTQSHSPIADILPPFSGMPRWLEDILLATGLLTATAFAAEPVAVLARRRRQRGDQSTKRRK